MHEAAMSVKNLQIFGIPTFRGLPVDFSYLEISGSKLQNLYCNKLPGLVWVDPGKVEGTMQRDWLQWTGSLVTDSN